MLPERYKKQGFLLRNRQKDYIFELLKSHYLELVNFFRGFWSGLPAEELGEHQDVILFKK